MSAIKSFGIRESETARDALATAVESIRMRGFCVVPSGLPEHDVTKLGARLEEIYRQQAEEFGGEEQIRRIGEDGMVRAPLAYDPMFAELACHQIALALATRLLGDYVVLNQQNGVINPPKQSFGQHSWHRDLPYQHFVSSRPIAVAALFCIDPFTEENGGTLVIDGSHRQEVAPSDAAFRTLAHPVEAPAGSFIIFDVMLYHRAGANRTDAPRRAVNHVFGRAFLRQQIDLPALLGGRYADDPRRARLFGYRDRCPTSVAAWREGHLARRSHETESSDLAGEREKP